MKIQVTLNGQVIETTQAKFDAARFECCLHGGLMKSFQHGITLDKWRNVRCASCGQHPHETATNKIKKMLV
jgi:hypothetical protein